MYSDLESLSIKAMNNAELVRHYICNFTLILIIILMTVFYAVLTSILLSVYPNQNVPYSGIEDAIEKNDSKRIVDMSKQKIMINVLGSEGVYGHSQAVLILKDFFAKNPGNKFDFTFKGKATTEGVFAIGNYNSRKSTYRVTVHFKKNTGDYKLESFTIEK